MGYKFGFGKELRIKDKKLIKKIYNKGFFYRGDFVYIHFLPEEEKKFSIRLERGIKGGLRRNKLRRILREIVRKANPSLKTGLYIVSGRKLALMKNYNTIRDDFDSICDREELWLK
jgi:ribonuclease P protein component